MPGWSSTGEWVSPHKIPQLTGLFRLLPAGIFEIDNLITMMSASRAPVVPRGISGHSQKLWHGQTGRATRLSICKALSIDLKSFVSSMNRATFLGKGPSVRA